MLFCQQRKKLSLLVSSLTAFSRLDFHVLLHVIKLTNTLLKRATSGRAGNDGRNVREKNRDAYEINEEGEEEEKT